MKVSVLVTFYNQEKYVDDALGSVFSQNTDFDFEVLIGDDGSTDGTIDKVKKWQEKYPGKIEIYIMPREEGVKYNGSERASRNRLNLLKYVKGEYFIFLDGDDFYIDDNKLKKQVEILDNPDNSKYVMCAHNVYTYYEDTGKSEPFLKCNHELKLKAGVYWGRFYFHPDSIMFRSKYINKIDTVLLDSYFNDNIIAFAFLPYGGVYYLPDIMASYRQTGDGIWTGNSAYIGTLRNIMDYDLELMIAPEFKDYSLVRHFRDFLFMRNRKEEPVKEKVAFYYDKIKRDRLKASYNWIKYSFKKNEDKRYLNSLFVKSAFLYLILKAKWLLVDTLIYHN